MTPNNQRARPSELQRGWKIILGCALGTGLGLPAVMSNSIGIFSPYLREEFGWSDVVIFGGLGVVTAAFLLSAPFIGNLIVRENPRKIITFSFAGLSVGYLSLSMSSGSVLQYYASWVIICMFGIGVTPITFTHIVNRAFDRQRGFALGVTLAGPGLIVLLIKPLAGVAVITFGWRVGMAVVGLLPCAIALPICLWALRSFDGFHDVAPDNRTNAVGLTLGEAARTYRFWILVAAFIPMALTGAGVLPHLEGILREAQLNQVEIIQLTALSGAAIAAGRLVTGWLMDKFWAPLIAAASLALGAVGMLILVMPGLEFSTAVLALVLFGFACGAEYDVLSYLTGRYFGTRHYGSIYAVMFALFAIGAGIGPGIIGFYHDSAETYRTILIAGSSILVSAGLLLLTLGSYPRFAVIEDDVIQDRMKRS